VSPFFYRFCRKQVGNGLDTLFSEDTWINKVPLRVRFKRLHLTFSTLTVAKVSEEGWGCIRCRRVLRGETTNMRQNIKDLCARVEVTEVKDKCSWLLEKMGSFQLSQCIRP
jgi:hypothetical protein